MSTETGHGNGEARIVPPPLAGKKAAVPLAIFAGLIAVCLLSLPVLAQMSPANQQDHSLVGRVWAGGVPAVGAQVELLSDTGDQLASTITDSEGHFSFNGLGHATFEVRVSLHGYRTAQKSVNVGSFGMESIVNLNLHRAFHGHAPVRSLGRYSLVAKAKRAYQAGQRQLAQGHPKAALRDLQQAVAAAPEFAAGYIDLGNVYFLLHHAGRARAQWRKALQLNPKLAPAAISLARLDNDHRHWRRALRRLHSVSGAGYWQYDWELGRAEYGGHHWAQAETFMHRAEHSPAGAALPPLHVLLANLDIKRHNFPAARGEFETYLRLAPHGTFAPRVRAIVRDMIAHHIPEPAALPPQ